MTDSEVWPDEALREQAGSIGPALLRLIDEEARWVHRRIERFELTSARQLLRSVSADLTVPLVEHRELALLRRETDRQAADPRRYVVPLGVLPKEPLQDFVLKPETVHRLTATQANSLVVAALAPDAEQCGAPLVDVLRLLRAIVRRETPGGPALDDLQRLLSATTQGSAEARERLRKRATMLDARYVLLVVIAVDAGVPTRVSYAHRQRIQSITGAANDPPLIIDVRLPHASGAGTAYRAEVVAPDGLEVETVAFVAREGSARKILTVENPDPGDGGFVHVRAPEPAQRPADAALDIRFGFLPGGVHHLATIAGTASSAALTLAFLVSLELGASMKGSSASTFLAAPALVTGLALGFATTRVTSQAVNRLRLAALAVALLGVLGGLTVALLGENADYLDERHVILGLLATGSWLVTGGFLLPAAFRDRERVELTSVAQ